MKAKMRAAIAAPTTNPPTAQPREVKAEETFSKNESHPSGKEGMPNRKNSKETTAPAKPHGTIFFKDSLQKFGSKRHSYH
ncbi:MAG: hypothetical protein CMI29_02215 [Opitutae bacterium]|nr:hypothetical protein [Opitutae bacterium]